MESEMKNGLPEQVPAEQTSMPAASESLTVEGSCHQLAQYLEDILQDAPQAHLDAAGLCASCRELGEALQSFQHLAEELVAYSTELSKGNLSLDFPESSSCLYGGLKNLHASLKHLTWQANQVSKGDYTQRVSHLGEFSTAFNAMTKQLKEREARLREEIQRARHRAEIIESYSEMLVDLLDQRDEWLLVVDQESRQIVHCNKQPPEGAGSSSFCEGCRHRLSIQSKILEWDASERYKVREVDGEQHTCYRVISFPIEWKERSSCVHIVVDITAEKMNARHLTDKVYHDTDTGIHNRKFLDEYMSRVLLERQNATLCYLDLEGVEDINTSYGHKVGNAYIQNFVETVRKNFRSGDTFARIKDDKFCLVLAGNVKHLIERKMAEILTIFQRNDDRIFCHSCSFKYSIVEVDGEENQLSLEDLLKQAESGIRRQKRKSRTLDFDTW